MPRVNRGFEHHIADSTIWIGSTPILKENTLESTPWPQRLYTLQAPMPSSGFEPKPYGTAVSVINHCTGWAALRTRLIDV
ncbi:hypothetical protein TNCV_884221 [Trichonephila clavipes]|nr:hypothetical protein TNCV_884221 [Trichonephila clavipes]